MRAPLLLRTLLRTTTARPALGLLPALGALPTLAALPGAGAPTRAPGPPPQAPPAVPAPSLQGHPTRGPGGPELVVTLAHVPAAVATLVARFDDHGAWIPLGPLALDGDRSTDVRLPLAPGASPPRLAAVWPAPTTPTGFGRVLAPPLGTGAGGGEPAVPFEFPQGEVWDFDWGSGGVSLAPGDVVSRSQPWSLFAHLSARAGGRPAEVVLVDQAPGPGPDLGSLLSVAPAPGTPVGAPRVLRIDFPVPTFVSSFVVADVLGAGGELRGYDGALRTASAPVPDLGGSGSAAVPLQGPPVFTALELELPGPGGFGELVLTPHRLVLDFDHSTTGVPLELAAGGQVGQAYAGIGLFGDVYAENANPAHPDLPLLFDSSDPTGGDGDLTTPGRGSGNRIARRKVLVIAENDLDADGDGLVDVPDDEAAGGVLRVVFITSSVVFRSATVIDVDDAGPSFVRVRDDLTGAVTDLPLVDLGDNSVQTVGAPVTTRQVELHLAGSGALAELQFDALLP